MRSLIRRCRDFWWLWRVRPGLKYAAILAEQEAYRHPTVRLLGPEQNLMRFAKSLVAFNLSM